MSIKDGCDIQSYFKVSKPWSRKHQHVNHARSLTLRYIPKDRVSKEVIYVAFLVSPWFSLRSSAVFLPGSYSLFMEESACILWFNTRTIRSTGGYVRDCSFYSLNRFTQSSFGKGKSINSKYVCAGFVDILFGIGAFSRKLASAMRCVCPCSKNKPN